MKGISLYFHALLYIGWLKNKNIDIFKKRDKFHIDFFNQAVICFADVNVTFTKWSDVFQLLRFLTSVQDYSIRQHQAVGIITVIALSKLLWVHVYICQDEWVHKVLEFLNRFRLYLCDFFICGLNILCVIWCSIGYQSFQVMVAGHFIFPTLVYNETGCQTMDRSM